MIDVTCDECTKSFKTGRKIAGRDGKVRCELCGYRRHIKLNRESNRKRSYNRDGYLRTMYNLAARDYAQLVIKQNGCCAICGKQSIGNLHVDHNHTTGKVRGLLCHKCNLGLGYYGDNPALLRKAAEYLESNDG